MSERISNLNLNISDVTTEECIEVALLSKAITNALADRKTHVCLHAMASALAVILGSTMDSPRSALVIAALVGAHAGIRAEQSWNEVHGPSQEPDEVLTKSEADVQGLKVEGADNAGA